MHVERIDDLHPSGERWYEIGFEGDVVDAVQRLTPAARVTDVPTCTILWSWGRRPDELDTLLDTLSGLGVSLREVYESAGGLHQGLLPRGGTSTQVCPASSGDDASRPYCEVRVGGRLGEAVLRYLGWSHRVAKITVVKLRTSHEELRVMLAEMAKISRVDYLLAL